MTPNPMASNGSLHPATTRKQMPRARALLLLLLLPGVLHAHATPSADARKPIFFECRGNRLYHINMESAKAAADRATAALWEKAGDDARAFQTEAAGTILTLPEGYQLDYTMTLIGRYTFRPDPTHEGYAIDGALSRETSDRWFGALLAQINPAEQFICFFTRPDSFAIFQKARNLAWSRNIQVSVELLTENDPIIFGANGASMLEREAPSSAKNRNAPQSNSEIAGVTNTYGADDDDTSSSNTPKFLNIRQDPLYVDVENDRLTIYPEKTVVMASDLQRDGNAFEHFLDQVESLKAERYIALMLRPDSALLQRRIRRMIKDRGIDISFEPFDFGREIITSNQQ